MKRLLIVLLTGLTILFAGTVLAEGPRLDADSADSFADVIVRMAKADAGQFEVQCSDDLYRELSDNDFLNLYVLCYENGVKDFSLSYIERTGRLFFSDMVYGGDPFAILNSVSEAERMVRRWLSAGAEAFGFYCADEAAIVSIRERISYILALYGYENYSGTSGSGIYFYSKLIPFSVPYAVASDIQDAADRLVAWHANGDGAFALVFPADSYQNIKTNERWKMEFLGGISDASRYSIDSLCTLWYEDVLWDENPAVWCDTEEDILSTIRGMGIQNETSFNIMMPPALFQLIEADHFSRLYKIEAMAGMSDCSLSYSDTVCALYFTDAVIHSDARMLETLPELLQYMAECAERMDESITLFMTDELYARILAGVSSRDKVTDKNARFYDLTDNIGICDFDAHYSAQAGLLTFNDIRYYPGYRILKAFESGDTAFLSAREYQTFMAAWHITQEYEGLSQLTRLRRIHDWLCRMIEYTNDETTDEDDNCIGAILSGRANCDGYADAMYLLGNMAGLQVRYQHGDSLDASEDNTLVTHMWNIVCLDGSWRLVDVTWDDGDDDIRYTWFNVGLDRAKRSHKWNEDMTMPLISQTDYTCRPEGEYLVCDIPQTEKAVHTARMDGLDSFVLFLAEDSLLTLDDMLETVRHIVSGTFYYSENPGMGYLRITLE